MCIDQIDGFYPLVGAVFYGIFSTTSQSGSFGTSDKTEHLFAFGVLSLYGLLILPTRLLWLFVTAVLVLAVGSEFIQAWLLPERHCALLGHAGERIWLSHSVAYLVGKSTASMAKSRYGLTPNYS